MNAAAHHGPVGRVLDWWAGPITHGDIIWLSIAGSVFVVLVYGGRRVADVWAERIKVRKRPAGILDVRILGTTAQVEAAMRAWLERGRRDP